MVSLFKRNSQLGEQITASLPNITGGLGVDVNYDNYNATRGYEGLVWGSGGALYTKCRAERPGEGGRCAYKPRTTIAPQEKVVDQIEMEASLSNSVYSASAGVNVVRPTSIGVSMWKRVL